MGNCLKKSKGKKEESPALGNNENSEKPLQENRETQEIKGKKPKSWETRPKLNKEDFQFKDRENEFLLKKPGQINGQQFIIERCKNCKILLCDYLATAFVDDCENCQIFIGPCSSSVFVRTSSNINIILACQQYRISESQSINSLLFCMTQPTLEKCSNLKFGCFKFGYFSLRENEQLGEVGVFSKKEDLDKNCFLPMTIGNMKKSEDDEALFFIHPEKASMIEQKICQLNNMDGCDLVRTKALKLTKIQIEQLFPHKTNFNFEEVINNKKESIFLLFSGRKCSLINDLISQTCSPGFFHIWDKKDSIKKCSSLVFDSWKSENAILK